MNGTDWPSPAANLQNIEAEIKEVLAATGVHVPSLMGMHQGLAIFQLYCYMFLLCLCVDMRVYFSC